jgi:hypothetical protein
MDPPAARRGPIAALAFFVVTLAPALGFFDVVYFVVRLAIRHERRSST